ncbi:MAG: bifunctional riboflavin kinase/FAD synthetase [Gammaproteobacteria bacterium]|nr:bifunctional riboflavin kinase/FAD synthetase [Gammaproteobacteria bacterium]
MQLVRGLHNLDHSHRGSVLTIGNFDGVHKGHQAILQRLDQCAAEHQEPSTVMIFEPHPEELFNSDNPPARLTRLREKLQQFRYFNVDRVVLVKFNQQFAQMTAEQFVTDLLLDKLGVKHLIIGDDFHFGCKRQGNYQLLTRMAEQHNFYLENTCTLSLGEERVSSTAVREALTSRDMKKAEALLGRVFSMSGRVFHGDKRGRQIGFPTANLLLHRNVLPLNGVFAVNLILNEGKSNTTEHQGIANIGRRPTVDGIREQLEVHLFDFDADIYGKAVTVEFLQFVRSEQKFSSIEQLKAQIEKDVASVKHFFNNTENA